MKEISKKRIQLHRSKCIDLFNLVIGSVHEYLLDDREIESGPDSIIIKKSKE